MKTKLTSPLSLSLFSFALIMIISFACQKKNEGAPANELTLTATHPDFNKEVGGPIDSATANRWRRNFAAQYNKSKGLGALPALYQIRGAVLKGIVNGGHAVGIMFYFGQDEEGRVSIVPIGVDKRGYVIQTTYVHTSNGMVSWQVAKAWRARFKQEHQNGIWGYFHGSNAVERLLIQGNEQIRIEMGLTDEGTQKIMLSNAELTDSETVEDMGRPCPNSCAFEDEIK